MSKRDSDKSLARNLGEFFGHLYSGVQAPPKTPDKRTQTLRNETQEESRPAPGGKVTLRRTTVEELEYEPDAGGQDPSADDSTA